SASINMGANYKLNKKNEFNLEYRYATNSIFDSSRIKSYNNLSFINNGIIDSVFQTSTINNSVFTFNNLNIGYWYNNKSFNADIQFYFDGMSKSEKGLADLLSSETYLNKQLLNNYSGLVNFRDTLLKKLELRYGLKRNFALSNEEINNIENIGIFRYTEEINALYSQLSGKSLSILWNIGLRFETTSWKINKPTNDNGFYLNLFPSLFLNKKFKNMTVNLSYTKRIQRQTISEANPLLRINNQLFTSVSGNIRLLKPQIFNSYEFNLDFKSFNLSTYFNRNINPRVFFPIEIDSLRIIYTPQSSKYENTFGLNLKLPIKYKMINTNLSLYSNLIISQLLNQKSVKGYSNSLVFNINYQLNNFAFSGSVNCSLPYKANYFSISSYWIANFSIAYQSKAKPWSIRLNLTDIFGRKIKWNINYPLVSEDLSNLSYSRAIQLGLRYNLKLGKEFNKKSYEGFLR
ncbi:MAG: outer membrane beta-barrel protein, partial [Saprospiraceae bacterium]